MPVPTVVQLQPDEVEPMRSAMRDVQVSIADYYRQTSGFITDPDEYTTPIRSAVAFIQKLNEVMQKELTSSDYSALFKDRLARSDPGAQTIEAFRYIRNVGQHLLHPVMPEPGRVVGGNLGLGFRTSSRWADVPDDVHALLHTRTRPLKTDYDHVIAGRPTLEPLLDACRFFAEVCPQLVHRDDTGEWTGFPLRTQWGTMERIHPQEPNYDYDYDAGVQNEEAIRGWLDARPPGGDYRWIAAKVTTSSGVYCCGRTFRNGISYLGFSESVSQIEADTRAGYTYWSGDPAENLIAGKTFSDRTGASFTAVSTSRAIEEWATGATQAAVVGADFCHWTDPAHWQDAISRAEDLAVRRAERLNAWFPIWR